MTRKQPRSNSCSICDISNLSSVCVNCVNCRLSEYHNVLKVLNSKRNLLYSRLHDALAAKEKADDQLTWRVQENEELAKLREKLRTTKEKLSQAKAKKKMMSHDLNVKYGFLESAEGVLAKHRSEKLEKYFPNWIQTQKLAHVALTRDLLRKQSGVIRQICKLFPQHQVRVSNGKKDRTNVHFDAICNACLPQGLDPHSVKSVELSASLGYMVQMLNIIVQNLAVPVLHNAAFAGSCSRIWQRDSYWDACSSSQSNEYPLFIPRQNHCSGAESSSSGKSSGNFGILSMESEKKFQLDLLRSSSFNFSRASSHTVENHEDVQRGVALLKKSVACMTAYYHHLLCLEFPKDASTFGAFAKLLAALAFPSVQHRAPLKIAASWSHKQGQQLNKSVGNANSRASSIALPEKSHESLSVENLSDSNMRGLTASLLSTYIPEFVKPGNTIEEWDYVEHLPLPPPPSEAEDVEHWTRAMFTDATTKK